MRARQAGLNDEWLVRSQRRLHEADGLCRDPALLGFIEAERRRTTIHALDAAFAKLGMGNLGPKEIIDFMQQSRSEIERIEAQLAII